MRYQSEAQGDWGQMKTTESIKTSTEKLAMPDGCQLFLRGWQTDSQALLLVLHGLGGHSGWYIDLGQELAAQQLTVYAMDHRGFGRSGGLAGHIDKHRTYIDDIATVVKTLRQRHPNQKVYVLGHSMGGIFTAYFAAHYSQLCDGVIFLNPWIQDTSNISLSHLLQIFIGGMLRSKRSWQAAGGSEAMTLNPEATRMLAADPHWRRAETVTFLVQIFFMRQNVLKIAQKINLPALVLQADKDLAVVPAATRTFYEQLASQDKTWINYPDFAHDSQFEHERSQLDTDIHTWINKHL